MHVFRACICERVCSDVLKCAVQSATALDSKLSLPLSISLISISFIPKPIMHAEPTKIFFPTVVNR